MGIKITGMGKKLPQKTVSNEELAAFLDTDDEWITSKTGIKTRRICTSESLTDIAEEAARNALENARLPVADMDMLICATVTGDYLMPSLACCVAQRLGAKCPAFDISAACTGFIYALDAADSYIKAGKAQNILIVCAEMMSRMVDWRDRTSCILFGDGAGACVVSRGDSLKYLRIFSEPEIAPLFAKAGRGNNPFIEMGAPPPSPRRSVGQSLTTLPHCVAGRASREENFLQMQGQHVYKFAVKTIETEINLALAALEINAPDVDYFILHQANARIIEGARARIRQMLPQEKFPMNIQKYGNMSAASIPVLLQEMAEDGRIKRGDTLMLIGFGAGMTAGTAVIDW